MFSCYSCGKFSLLLNGKSLLISVVKFHWSLFLLSKKSVDVSVSLGVSCRIYSSTLIHFKFCSILEYVALSVGHSSFAKILK